MSFWANLKTWFENVGHEIADFTSNLARSIAQNGGTVLARAAEAEVAAAESAIATGSKDAGRQKFEMAQAGVIKQLTEQGVPVVLNAVNGAIEAAVANLKAPPASADPAKVNN